MFFLPDRISFPASLEETISKALWKNSPNPEAIRSKGNALRTLWEKLAKKRGIISPGETHYSLRSEEADAYASYYLMANALKPAAVLEESYLLGFDPLPDQESVWLDLGTGPGTAYWGLAWWCSQRNKNLRFIGWDQSPAFLDIAHRITANSPYLTKAEFHLAGKKAGSDWQTLIKKYAPTHISFVNSLAEIYPDPEARAYNLKSLLESFQELKRRDGKRRFLLLLEPGSRESSRELSELKQTLTTSGLGTILLPCLDNRPCGALADSKDWCHEEVACEFPSWHQELGALAGLKKEAMLFSYSFMSADPMESPWQGMNRIVSQRLERKGQVECRLCTKEGKRPVRVQRSKSSPETEDFFQSCRGEIWSESSWKEKGDLVEFKSVKPNSNSIF